MALEWALDSSKNLGPVRTVTAFRVGPFGDGFGTFAGAEPGMQIYEDAARARLKKVLDSTDPSLMDTATVVESGAGAALVKAAKDASLLVVGSRGRSGLAETLLGSVGSYCIKHSLAPVAVITGNSPTRRPLKDVVVGVDGSDNSRAALRWALDHTDPEGTVTALGCYNPVAYAIEAYMPPRELLEKQTRDLVEESLAQVAPNDEAGPRVEVSIQAGDPRMVMRTAGEKADLLVVGSRGHRGVNHLILGSVTTSLLHHPTAATVVVPY